MDLDSDGEEQVRNGRRKGRSSKTFKSACVPFPFSLQRTNRLTSSIALQRDRRVGLGRRLSWGFGCCAPRGSC